MQTPATEARHKKETRKNGHAGVDADAANAELSILFTIVFVTEKHNKARMEKTPRRATENVFSRLLLGRALAATLVPL